MRRIAIITARGEGQNIDTYDDRKLAELKYRMIMKGL